MDVVAGKVAVITGGAGGIGRAVAKHAAELGMKIVIADIEERALDGTARELRDGGADVLAVVTDVADGASVEELRDRTLSRFGSVALVHNNAGVGVAGPAWSVSEADWRWILGVNLWGVIHGIRAFVPFLIEQGDGHVVNTASLAGLVSPPFFAPYCATKHAVVTISEILYRDLRIVGSAVGVSVLCPAYVKTGIAESDRNRPVWAPAPPATKTAEYVRGLTQQRVAEGIDASIIAEHVLDAVRTKRFYILTHPEANGAIELRMQDILAARAPSDIDLS